MDGWLNLNAEMKKAGMDKKAKNILVNTFWINQGWKERPSHYSGENFEDGKSKGLMFDLVTIGRDEWVRKIVVMNATVDGGPDS